MSISTSSMVTWALVWLPCVVRSTWAYIPPPLNPTSRKCCVSRKKEGTSTANPNLQLKGSDEMDISRREVAVLAIGAVAYGKLVSTTISKVSRGDAYPPEHEYRTSNIFQTAIVEAAGVQRRNTGDSGEVSDSFQSSMSLLQPLRVLEVGIGNDYRTIMRGMYDGALQHLSNDESFLKRYSGVELTGVDIDIPSPLSSSSMDKVIQAREMLSSSMNQSRDISISFNAVSGDVVKGLPFPDNYFDAITCSLVFCSVTDQIVALEEVKRVLNTNRGSGSTFGYVEHVAVNLSNEDERKQRSFLEWQQRVLDPLQQAVAHNCHLHRATDSVISTVFGVGSLEGVEMLDEERFFVDGMWPVSCQCKGVIKHN